MASISIYKIGSTFIFSGGIIQEVLNKIGRLLNRLKEKIIIKVFLLNIFSMYANFTGH